MAIASSQIDKRSLERSDKSDCAITTGVSLSAHTSSGIPLTLKQRIFVVGMFLVALVLSCFIVFSVDSTTANARRSLMNDGAADIREGAPSQPGVNGDLSEQHRKTWVVKQAFTLPYTFDVSAMLSLLASPVTTFTE